MPQSPHLPIILAQQAEVAQASMLGSASKASSAPCGRGRCHPQSQCWRGATSPRKSPRSPYRLLDAPVTTPRKLKVVISTQYRGCFLTCIFPVHFLCSFGMRTVPQATSHYTHWQRTCNGLLLANGRGLNQITGAVLGLASTLRASNSGGRYIVALARQIY